MKILFVTQYYYPEHFVTSEIAEEFVRRGHDVTVLTCKPTYGYIDSEHKYTNLDYEELNGVKIHRLTVPSRDSKKRSIIKNYLSFWKKSKKWVKETQEFFQLVYSFSLSPVTSLCAGNLYAKKHDVPHIGHIVDIWPESVVATHYARKFSLLYPVLWIWSKLIYKRLDSILVGSPSYKEYFNKVLHIKNKNIVHVNQPALLADEAPTHEFDKQYFNIVYSGNISPLQLVNLFIPSFARTEQKIRFHIIGGGSYLDSMKLELFDFNVQDRVTLYGPLNIDDSISYIKGADAVIVSLSKKGYVGKTIPNKLTVAMAYKKPIISILSGDGRAILEHNKSAVIAEEHPLSISKAINLMANYPSDFKNKMTDINYEYYKNNLSLEKIVDSILEQFSFTLSKRK